MTQDIKNKAPETQAVQMISLTINGDSVTVPRGTTVLEAAKMSGIEVPTFCWHAKLKPVGACRICYVEIEKMPKLQVSCATEAMDGMVVHTESDQVKQGRRAVIEFTLIDHPLDCPTCDKGGECDLQDITFDHGYDDTRSVFRKNRFLEEGSNSTFDDLKIGPEIILNRNRCILCYKCVRANKEAFGEYDLGCYERGNIAEINAAPGEEVDNPFSGNLVEICPVGALTNSDWRYKIRVWLTKTTDSLCNFSSSGTNIKFTKEDHKNHIFRVTSRCNDDIDDGWLSDITRYGYQAIKSPDRLQKPLVKKDGKQVEVSWDEALEVVKNRFADIKDKKGSVCISGLASSHLDNASLYSFSKFFRTVLKSNNIDSRFDYRMLPKEENNIFDKLASQPFSIADIDNSDLIIVFGSDLIREHHNEYLRIRKAKYFGSAKVFSINPYAVKTADVADLEIVYEAGQDEMVINAICLAAQEENLVEISKTNGLKDKISSANLEEALGKCKVSAEDIKEIAKALARAKKITFITGEIVTRSREREAIAAAISNLNYIFEVSDKGQIASLARNANSMGASKMGLLAMPGENMKAKMKSIWGEYPESKAHNTDSMLALMKKEEITGGFIFGANPMMTYPDREFVREGLEKLEFLVVADMFESETTEMADVVLPLCSWAEYTADYVNLEGKNQTANQAIKPIGMSKPGYEIINLISEKYSQKLFENSNSLQDEVDQMLSVKTNKPLPKELIEVSAETDSNVDGFDTVMFINDDPHHYGYITEKSESLSKFVGGAYIEMSKAMAEKLNVKERESVRVESPVGKIIVPVKISQFLTNDVVLIPRNFSSTPVTSLLMRKQRLDKVKLSRVED